jgi:hypothetical protein
VRRPAAARRGPTAARRGPAALAAALALGTVLVASGCSHSANADADRATHATASPARQPAALAGGACQLLDYDVIDAELGTRFAIAASAVSGATFTCALQPADAGEPDLSLAVTATEADPTVFRTTVVPKGATVIQDLGKIGYQAGIPAAGGAGPGIEVGWLSGNQRLMVLRYRGAAGAAVTDVNALLPKLVELARKVDMTTV